MAERYLGSGKVREDQERRRIVHKTPILLIYLVKLNTLVENVAVLAPHE